MNPWPDLIAELKAHQAWHHPSYRPTMSAYVGVESNGRYYGGVNIDAERMGDEDMGDEDMAAFGDSPEAVITDLIRRLRSYRADRDRERGAGGKESMTPTPDPLNEHEQALLAFARYMLAPERANPATTDMAEVGKLAAFVINGLPAVRAALARDVPALREAIDRITAMHDYRPSSTIHGPQRCSFHRCDDSDCNHVDRGSVLALLHALGDPA